MDALPFHIGIATDDLEASMREIGAALGLSWTDPDSGGELYHVDGPPQPRPVSCISREGPIHVDLMQGEPGTVWETSRPKLHHFAYWTNDLRGDIARLTGEGWRLELSTPGADGEPTVFAYLVRADGFRLELIDDANRSNYTDRLD
jgi:catechol 2,3-dioxygenase-like lactoylglutathione lyase family enzyme